MTETFTFAQLNFSEDGHQRHLRRNRKLKNLNHNTSVTPTATESSNTPPSSSPSSTSRSNFRSSSMSIFATQKIISHPSFDPSKYVRTSRGLINKSIFSLKRTTTHTFLNARYISDFPYSVIRDASTVISQNDSVLKFVLDHLKQLPCNVPIRWGVLFNLKFRRIFQCLDVDKWVALATVLERHGFAKSERLNVFLLDPTPSVIEYAEYADLLNDLSSNSSSVEEVQSTEIDPFRTPQKDSNGTVIFNTRLPSSSRSPTIPIDSPAVTPVPRAQNDSIYAIKYRNSADPILAPRFRAADLDPAITNAIKQIFNHAEFPLTTIFKQLRELPVGIPLRWGCIYNKHLRIRRQINSSSEAIITLAQWKEVKNILIEHGYLDGKTVMNCSILKNK